MTNTQPGKKSGCGCFAKGCITLVILAAIIIGLAAWGVKKGVDWVQAQTSNSPIDVPVENATHDEYEALVKKLNAFKDATSENAQTLELTAHDLNVLVAECPEWADAKGKIHFAIDGGQVGVTGSVPLTRVPQLHDQYLNGILYFVPSIDDKGLNIEVRSMDLRSKNATNTVNFSATEKEFITGYCRGFLASKPLPVLGPVLSKAKTLKIDGDAITLTSE